MGWIFWQNSSDKKDAADKTSRTSLQTSAETKKDGTDTQSDIEYVVFRINAKDGSGVKITAADDLSKLTGASQKLKDYIASNLGKEYQDPEGATHKMTFTVDRVYGDYAAGVNTGAAYLIWGPKNSTGAITNVAGTQNEGFRCSDLTAAKVPKKLVDSKCSDFNGEVATGTVDYK